MLRVTVHAGPVRGASRFNRLDWLDIGYARLGPVADYKVLLFRIGEGAAPPVTLASYPRWSGSLWDLSARSIALASSRDAAPSEDPAPAQHVLKRAAFAQVMSAVISHLPTTGTGSRQLATVEISNQKRTRGVYRARFTEDLGRSVHTEPFVFAPGFLRPAELVMRACLFRLAGDIDRLPPRPQPAVPTILPMSEGCQVVVDTLDEPLKSGFLRWLIQRHTPAVAHVGVGGHIAPQGYFDQFLATVV